MSGADGGKLEVENKYAVGPGFVVPGLLAAVVAELVMGGASVTAYQRAAQHSAPVGHGVTEQ